MGTVNNTYMNSLLPTGIYETDFCEKSQRAVIEPRTLDAVNKHASDYAKDTTIRITIENVVP